METSQIVATGSILIEHKFVRNCGKARFSHWSIYYTSVFYTYLFGFQSVEECGFTVKFLSLLELVPRIFGLLELSKQFEIDAGRTH